MPSSRSFLLLILLGLLGLTLLFGCRAFQPEVVIVNQPPETYITGAPAETSGGYYHFHMFWYGTDPDGRVERFVWALTDTSVQDYTISGDEEDARFNPATNISTLAIGRWTTRTDSVFDFQIRQGATPSAEFTFHIVAVDDRGDYDRTPARLRFQSNALGNPTVTFYSNYSNRPGSVFANYDTIGYGKPFSLSWRGSTPNIRSYSAALLAARDTVPTGAASADGLYGFKYLLGDDEQCITGQDRWRPRRLSELTGDSTSVFSVFDQRTQRWVQVDSLYFANTDVPLPEDPCSVPINRRLFSSGAHRLLVNTIDVAGVEVPSNRQALNFVINYDPDTRLLRNERDFFNPDLDDLVYPRFRVFQIGGGIYESPFNEGDRVPDRSYVIFKALGWDDTRDARTTLGYRVGFQGAVTGFGLYQGTSPFNFSTQYSDVNYTPQWDRDPSEGGGSADTVGFLVGPFDYTFNMRSVDEHGRRDGTSASFQFSGNFPPCVQCVELLAGDMTPGAAFGCDDGDCAAEIPTIYAAQLPDPPVPPDWRRASLLPLEPSNAQIWFNLTSGTVWLSRPGFSAGVDSIAGSYYAYEMVLHGADHPLEPAVAYDSPEFSRRDRVRAWSYEVVTDTDPVNAVADGGGNDNFSAPTVAYSLRNAPSLDFPVVINEEGLWRLQVRFFVPGILQGAGEGTYRAFLVGRFGANADRAFRLTTGQLGITYGRFEARDVNNCLRYPERSMYHFFRNLRVPVEHGMDCNRTYGPEDAGRIPLEHFPGRSETFYKQWRVKIVISADNSIFPA